MSHISRADNRAMERGVGAAAEMPAIIDGVLCDAATATIPVYDDGLLRGDGAFEFLPIYAGRPFTLSEHLDRLQRTCTAIRLECPRERIEADVATLLATAGPAFGDLRIVLTRGGRRMAILEPHHDKPPPRLTFVTDTVRPLLAGAKSLSYAGNMLAKRVAEERGFDEALLTTPGGHVLESQQAAFFWVAPKGDLCTPPLSEGILDSITRRVVMARLDVSERVCRTQDALAAREAFLAGSARAVHAVAAIEGRVFDELPGPVTQQAMAAYRCEVERRLGLSAAELWSDRAPG